mmetsp:Transcript_17432/g.34698  ORF Transcript_17432/g.34698 Transcript_17432/m.34698 type:complete len:280 (-) Transcript_17432:132-971(-)
MTTRASKVFAIHRFIAFATGATMLFFAEEATTGFSTGSNPATFHDTVVCRSCSASILCLSLLVHTAIRFSPAEKDTIARCMLVSFLAVAAVFARLSDTGPLSEADRIALVSSTAAFAGLAMAYAWACWDPRIVRNMESPAPSALSPAFGFHNAVGFASGSLSLLYPAGFYELPQKYLSLSMDASPTTNELVLVSMWGGFILNFSLVAGRAPRFSLRSQRIFAQIMVIQFIGLTLLYAFYWDRLNDIYKYGGVPPFLCCAGFYVYGLVRQTHEPAGTKKD